VAGSGTASGIANSLTKVIQFINQTTERSRQKRAPMMLYEDDVVEAVCEYLKQSGYRIVSHCTSKQRGIDIVAEHVSSNSLLRVEAKGETSKDSTRKRFGKPFDNAQVHSHVAGAFFAAAAMLDGTGARVALAFPDTPLHRRHVSRIGEAIRRLEIAVFWIDANRGITIESARPL